MSAATDFSKVLVANRGEIAVRVIEGARRLGYRTVAVYSDADREALHVKCADEAVRIGAAPVGESYLVIDKLIAAAKSVGADAIHPGYGFLSERAEFALAVRQAGLVFIGPDPESIAAMGNKSASKRLMLDAGVPCVPGYQGAAGEAPSDETLLREARRIGLPVMIKAAAGGGGRGMRLVHDDAQLAAAIASARSEADGAFGSGELLVEKAVVDARHVEIQVFGDRHGQIVHLGERDCSVQRRNQKVVEEAPSPAVDETLRARMGDAAVAAARAVTYVGAGTVEFMLAADGAFYFLEMNTRLQVEHPVTERVYGVDLVEWQLRIARGEKLPMSQAEINARRRGAAIEVRLCAEDPARDYLPQTGRVLHWQPPAGEGIRVDSGLYSGLEIGAFYDSMQAKIIAWGADRETARTRLLQALQQTVLLGVTSNKDFLRAIIAHPAFADGKFSTGFIAEHFAQRIAAPAADLHGALAAIALYLDDARALAGQHQLADEFVGWHSSHETAAPCLLKCGDQQLRPQLRVRDGRFFSVAIGERSLAIEVVASSAAGCTYVLDGVHRSLRVARDGAAIWIDDGDMTACYIDQTLAPAAAAAAGSDGRLLAHSDGRIVAVHVEIGQRVERNTPLAALEAMKMEFQLVLPIAGVVESIGVQAGQQVKTRQLLVQIRPDA
ncbi:acetyl/propionyl/methylcrotonyl-CoA carboxylase subunit alpha [Hydrocarboniphaga sp.]|uniref:acetyl/propionyl/methylcrotonyl-CoA carboxylase subunit alpha n=1 Tax=Hydrocarboniphaga sp. TaxID=2033016 RepID=UPI003D0F9CDE